MMFLRFALWNLGVRLCDRIGFALDWFALTWERKTGRESAVWGCRLHPASLLPRDEAIPEIWWSMFGWRKP